MRQVEPEVYVIAESRMDVGGLVAALKAIGGDTATSWLGQKLNFTEGEMKVYSPEEIYEKRHSVLRGDLLTEVAGRTCYKSYGVGLNPNVTKIREDSKDYIDNTLAKGDGSIFEHSTATIAFVNVSRVMTHELVRHRVGVAISQESLRYVRPTDLGLWLPPDTPKEIREYIESVFRFSEETYKKAEAKIEAFNTTDFDAKKRATSLLRRMLPQGMATNIIVTFNHRTLRHLLAVRTAPGAEIEIRIVFDKVGFRMKERFPLTYADFTRTELPDGTGSWVPKYQKV